MNFFEKLKAFLGNKITQIVEVVLMILCGIGLISAGWKGEDIHSLVDFAGAGIIAILAIVKFVKSILNRNGGD